MTIKRMTKADRPQSLGTYMPVGHVVVALPSQASEHAVISALRDAGFDDEDLLHYSAAESHAQMEDMLAHASDFAGFGYEVTLMRRYQALSREGCHWLMVYAPDSAHVQRVADVAQRFGARTAVKYHWLAVEDLI